MDFLAKLPAAEVSIAAALAVLTLIVLRLVQTHNGLKNRAAPLEARVLLLEQWRDTHQTEVRPGFERLARMESEVEQLKQDVRETRAGHTRLVDALDKKVSDLKDALHEVELRILQAIRENGEK